MKETEKALLEILFFNAALIYAEYAALRKAMGKPAEPPMMVPGYNKYVMKSAIAIYKEPYRGFWKVKLLYVDGSDGWCKDGDFVPNKEFR